MRRPVDMYTNILVYYGEIGLKGRNRSFFERQLVQNILVCDAARYFLSVRRISGRILVTLREGYDRDEVNRALSHLYGIVYFLWVESCRQDVADMTRVALAQAQSISFETFAVRAKRQDRTFPLSRSDIEHAVGGAIDEVVTARVDLSHPEVTFNVVIVERYAFVGYERVMGAGGLPVGVSGRVLVLLSGGIDSPVAASLLQKRGCPVDFIHFHNAPYTSDASRDKAIELARLLANNQATGVLHLVPFTDIQKEIVKHTDQQYRVLLYRRYMLRIAEMVARKHRVLALATGDSIGQVASQTIENLSAVNCVSDMIVLRPLLTWDKQEVIDVAHRIGTFELSSLPHDDCCSYFMPRSPATHATRDELDTQETHLSLSDVVGRTIDMIERIDV